MLRMREFQATQGIILSHTVLYTLQYSTVPVADRLPGSTEGNNKMVLSEARSPA